MVTLIIILTAVLMILGWLLLTPITLRLDSENQYAGLRVWGLGRGHLMVKEDVPFLRIHFMGLRKDIDLFRFSKKKKQQKKSTPSAKSRSRKKSFRKFRRIIESFELRYFRLVLDTQDFVWNSYLFALYPFFQRKDVQLEISYRGQFLLQTEIRNRLVRVLWAIFR